MCNATYYNIEGYLSNQKSLIMNVGSYIRQKIIPSGMSVTNAAKQLGVGRPALSNLLNGKSSLSPKMALRLERAFGADQQTLLDLQAEMDRDRRREEDRTVAVGSYVPNFLEIRARQIDDWAAANIDARQQLPALLRRLIHSTGQGLRHVDFPGYDNAQRRGWDGWVEADIATPWIPEGKSGWEFGTNQNPKIKADHDYSNRVRTVSAADRAECAFVFVTPRNWSGKDDWARRKAASRDWKDVRVFDASDLEQWLEESIAARIWLAEELRIPTEGFVTLDQCWTRWADASAPAMTAKVFEPSIKANRGKFEGWLSAAPDRPFTVAADSKDEAVAFLACLSRDINIPKHFEDQAVLFESAQTLRALARSSSPFMPIVYTQEAEREIASVYRQRHCIVVRPRNAVDQSPDIAPELLGHEAFNAALADMGIKNDKFDRLARESGRSPTILRRRLCQIPAIRTPEWAADSETARSLIPMALVGAWHAESNADCEILSTLANSKYAKIEETIAHLLELDDCPVWSVSQYRGVASKIDALFAISRSFTAVCIEKFLELAEYVLSESDPALDLPETERRMAGIYDKVREHSKALRDGICETLVLLAVHGNDLFQNRLGINIEVQISGLIRRLLTPMTPDKLLSHERDLPSYAEAAPDEILALLETDLRQPEPVVRGLFKPVPTGAFDHPTRTGILWALECLAWNPQNLARVSVVLAQLSRIRIDDNRVNRPTASLGAIYRSWCPQTAAPLCNRIKGLEMLADKFPDLGWQICIEQLNPGPQWGDFSYRPRWRADASGTGWGVIKVERDEFVRRALDLALTWREYDSAKLGDLVERLPVMADEDQSAVWDLVDRWSKTETNDAAKAQLRERIRRFVFTERGRHRKLKAAMRDRARDAREKLEPRSLVSRYAWLFASEWVEVSADEFEGESMDISKREERIHQLRTEAMGEIWAKHGFAGILLLAAGSDAPYIVGRYAALTTNGTNLATKVLDSCLSCDADSREKLDAFMQGFIRSVDATERPALLMSVLRKSAVDQKLRLLGSAPCSEQTWRILNQQPQDVIHRYWREVNPRWDQLSEAELIELIDRLLEANRPHTAFHVVRWNWNQIETSRLKRLLVEVATNAEPARRFELDAYSISSALDSLDGRAGVTLDDMVRLELAFIGALDDTNHGIPNLERKVAESPELFVQALALCFRRRDHGQDPPDWRICNPDQRAAAAETAYRLLERISRIPGTDDEGNIDAEALQRWVTEVRHLCVKYGRMEIGDQYIGQLLSKAPAEQSGLWPCRPVCEVIEVVPSENIAVGFCIGVYNARGVQWRGEGGDQERELAARYRSWEQELEFDYPHVSNVLEQIAVSYDREGQWWDSEANVRRRLGD